MEPFSQPVSAHTRLLTDTAYSDQAVCMKNVLVCITDHLSSVYETSLNEQGLVIV